ncbi:YqiA/YcfP family alpha/beta fold hydrolase [Acinetobacter sp. HY1485]|uniref:YqiA/YcfP family alpha/beta fold hydrolase n=1 Tax=Acinetobacter sp. HY1485 TaxID=2970918 RepID=UPI0022B97310|nr:YqiA/YcfP family alpha/beta fold hydrolase [Acinetobacter sp. HY1485]
MKNNNVKILFFHGLDSSKESTKFHAIHHAHKFCIDMDYRNLNYETVNQLYQEMVKKIKPNLLVGHSLGGYWALKMSLLFKLPAIVANPSLNPMLTDYPELSDQFFNHDIPQFAYLELADELVDMQAVQQRLERFMFVQTYDGGYHRLQYPEHLNNLIQDVKNRLAGVG